MIDGIRQREFFRYVQIAHQQPRWKTIAWFEAAAMRGSGDGDTVENKTTKYSSTSMTRCTANEREKQVLLSVSLD